MTKKTRNKKRAKGINKSEPPRRAQKGTFLRVFLPHCKIYHQEKESRRAAHKKSQKNAVSHHCARIIDKKPRNIGAIRPFCAYIDYCVL